MIYLGSEDGRKRLGLEMEETEVEEGEALNYHDEDENSTVDPDIALSYIEEKIQNVLGHFQKDFEGGVTAENLGAKFGGYGSFLPTYQRSPASSHTKSPPEVNKRAAPKSPRKLQVEDRGQSSFVSGKNSCTVDPLKGDGYFPHRQAEESVSDCGFVKKSVNRTDQRILKVRIKVGTEKLSTQKNDDIYSGLGLVVTPSSSLDDGPTTTEGKCGKSLDLPDESPTSILQIMTFTPEQLLSPLPENLIYLTEKIKLEVKTESKSVDKSITENSKILVNGSHSSKNNQKIIEQKKPRSSEKDKAFSVELSNLKNNSGYQDNSSSLVKKEKESYPQQDVLKIAKYHASNQSDSNVYKEPNDPSKQSVVKKEGCDTEEILKPTQDKRKQKEVYSKQKDFYVTPKSVKSEKMDSRDIRKDHEKQGDIYKDFFGDLAFEEDDNESISGGKNSSEKLVGKKSLNEHHVIEKEKHSITNFGKTCLEEKYPRVDSHEAPPVLGNGPSSEAPTGMENEEWVFCDKCCKWRLLPLGTDPKSLPDKWLCRMLTWLPGMNHCSIPEAETTNALRALYHPVPSILDIQHGGLYGSGLSSVGVAPVEVKYPGQDHQNVPTGNTINNGKKKTGMSKAAKSTDLDSSTHSSNSWKKNLPKSGKNSNLNTINHSPKDANLKRKSKPASDSDGSRASKRTKGEKLHEKDVKKKIVSGMTELHSSDDGFIRSSKSNGEDSVKKRKENRGSQINVKPVSSSGRRLHDSGNYTEEMCENDLPKEKRSKPSKPGPKDTSGSKDEKSKEQRSGFSKTDMVSLTHSLAANSSSSKVSGSHKNKQEVKGSPVESVTSGSGLDKNKIKASVFSHDSLDHVNLKGENSESKKNKFDEKSFTPGKADKSIVKQDKEKSTTESKPKSIQPLPKVKNENLPSLPPNSRSEKQKSVKKLAVDAFENGDSSDLPSQSKKSNGNQIINLRHPTPNSNNVQAPSPARRDSSTNAANSALKEAKDLKHLADRQKSKGSSESSGLYLQSVLKFLHGAFLLESGSSAGTKQYESSMDIYSTTAKLCEFCAHEYEKSKDMAGAALAYKCMEVAYMRVVYSGHASASRDRNELQTSLQIVPPGESPSSSASDVDNLNNNQATTDKAVIAKVVGSPQVSGTHVITSRNRSSCLRLLNFAQDVNFAMEASRKSRAAFSAAVSKLGVNRHEEGGISSLKKALDFHFHDIEGLLRIVRVAMDAITR